MKIDQKYKGIITKRSNGSLVPENEWIVFRAKDLALPRAMDAYIDECRKLGCSPEFIQEFIKLKGRVIKFQIDNPERCKIPD